MRPLAVDEIRVGAAYEAVRATAHEEASRALERARVPLSESMVLVIEDRESIRGALEEAVRAERISDPGELAREVESVNAAVPGDGEVLALLYLALADPAELRERLPVLLEVARSLVLVVGTTRIEARPPVEGAVGIVESQAVQPVVFPLGPGERATVSGGSAPVAVEVTHPVHGARRELDEGQRAALAQALL